MFKSELVQLLSKTGLSSQQRKTTSVEVITIFLHNLETFVDTNLHYFFSANCKHTETAWTVWSGCNPACGEGTRMRTRSVVTGSGINCTMEEVTSDEVCNTVCSTGTTPAATITTTAATTTPTTGESFTCDTKICSTQVLPSEGVTNHGEIKLGANPKV